MTTFVYTARDESGAPVNGTLVAASLAEVSRLLRAEGKYPTSVRAAAGRGDSSDALPAAPAAARAGIKIRRDEVVQVSTQLAIMIETGVTLTEGLDCIALQTTKPNLRAIVEDLGTQLKGGSDFSLALSRHPRSFPRLFVALISASERTGMLSRMLQRGTQYLRDEQETLRRVRGALTYPGIMLGFALTTTLFLLAFVLPRFTVIYASKRAALPLPTKILMTMSDFVVGHWIVLLLGAAALAGMVWAYVGTAGGARTWHFLQLNVPLLGGMYRKLHLARGMRMIGTMAGAGVNLVDCVSTAQALCSNSYFRELWDEVSDKIQAGKQMSEPLAQSALVPRSIAQMIHSGEKGGKLAHVMEQVASFSEQELQEKIAELTRYIEPAMIVVMGLIIGGVALALMLPIFTISRVVAN
jgi:type IV pilus assembly protein PilC